MVVASQDTQGSDLKIKLKDRWRRTRAKITRSLADLVASPGRHHLYFDEVRGGLTQHNP